MFEGKCGEGLSGGDQLVQFEGFALVRADRLNKGKGVGGDRLFTSLECTGDTAWTQEHFRIAEGRTQVDSNEFSDLVLFISFRFDLDHY